MQCLHLQESGSNIKKLFGKNSIVKNPQLLYHQSCVNILDVPFKVLAIEFFSYVQYFCRSATIHCQIRRPQSNVEKHFKLIQPSSGKSFIVAHNCFSFFHPFRVILNILDSIEDMANPWARNNFNLTPTHPDSQGALHMFSTPNLHFIIKNAKLDKPFPVDGKWASNLCWWFDGHSGVSEPFLPVFSSEIFH